MESPFLRACHRAKGLIDLNPLSPTYGCPDRGYWHYQDGKGFAVASMATAVWGFALAHQLSYSGFDEAARAVSTWWSRQIVTRKGLDEYFPNQKSFCALAHTTMSMALASLTNREVREITSKSLSLALDLLTEDALNPESANQSLAAKLAWDLCRPDQPNPFDVPVDRSDAILLEYGGFDLCYTLKCLNIIVLGLKFLDPAKQTPYQDILQLTLKSLKRFVVDYTWSPELSTRGNPHKLLGGLEILAKSGCEYSRQVIHELNSSRFLNLVSADTCDDKYHSFFHLTDLAFQEVHKIGDPIQIQSWQTNLPAQIEPEGVYRSARFFLKRTSTFRLAIAWQAGGSVLFETVKERKIFGHSIYKLNGRPYRSIHGPIQTEFANEASSMALPIRLQRIKFRATLVQNPWLGTLLKIGLYLPVARSMLRKFIYASSLRAASDIQIGVRKIEVGDVFSIRDEYHTNFELKLDAQNWSFIDGHSTRLSSSSGPAFVRNSESKPLQKQI